MYGRQEKVTLICVQCQICSSLQICWIRCDLTFFFFLLCYDSEKCKDVSDVFGIRLCFLRCQAGLTQAQLGQRLNITASALGMYEQGRRVPSASTIVAIAKELDVSCEFLLSGCGVNEQEAAMELMVSMFVALGHGFNGSSANGKSRTRSCALKRMLKQI